MRKILLLTSLMLTALGVQAQEKVINIVKTDGTTIPTRLAEFKQMSFLTVEEGGQGLLIKTLGGETVSVQFEANPVVTVSSSNLVIKSTGQDNVTVEITNIAEIVFGDASNVDAIKQIKSFDCVLQQGGAKLRGIPSGVVPRVYSLDGRSIPTPPVSNGELLLNRATLGTGVFIIKVGTFSTKIQF